MVQYCANVWNVDPPLYQCWLINLMITVYTCTRRPSCVVFSPTLTQVLLHWYITLIHGPTPILILQHLVIQQSLNSKTYICKATLFFFSVSDERALDLGHALPKKTCVFFLPSARIELLPIFEKKHLILVDKKTLRKKPSSFQEIKKLFSSYVSREIIQPHSLSSAPQKSFCG